MRPERERGKPDERTVQMGKELMEAMPGLLQNEDQAVDAVEIILANIPRTLKNADQLRFEGIGEFSVEGSKDHKNVVFTPDPKLIG